MNELRRIVSQLGIKIIGMTLVGLSAFSMNFIGLWFLIPWIISWLIYDLNGFFDGSDTGRSGK